MKQKTLLIILLAVIAVPLLAQDEFPRVQVFGGYSYFNLDTSGLTNRQNFNGWNAQTSYNFNRWLGVTADFGGYYGNVSGVSLHDYTYMFGPTVTLRAQHIAPFFHTLFGGSHAGGSALGVSGSDSSFAMAVGGGFDWNLKPNLGLRLAQVDWLRTQHFNNTQNNVRISTGIFFNFGGK